MGTEICDDSTILDQGCLNNCSGSFPGWICTSGALGSTSSCSNICGDGYLVQVEGCDDNNTIDGDGCSSVCTVEVDWICQGQLYELSVCNPVCKDGKNYGTECDAGTDFGCLDDCSAIHPCYSCSGGTTTTPMSCVS